MQRLSYQFRMLVSIVVVSWINWDPWKIGRTSSACNIHMRFCFQFLPFPKHDFGKPRQFRCMCIYKWCFVMLRHYSLRKSLGLFIVILYIPVPRFPWHCWKFKYFLVFDLANWAMYIGRYHTVAVLGFERGGGEAGWLSWYKKWNRFAILLWFPKLRNLVKIT